LIQSFDRFSGLLGNQAFLFSSFDYFARISPVNSHPPSAFPFLRWPGSSLNFSTNPRQRRRGRATQPVDNDIAGVGETALIRIRDHLNPPLLGKACG
jgi:hypothetical protein